MKKYVSFQIYSTPSASIFFASKSAINIGAIQAPFLFFNCPSIPLEGPKLCDHLNLSRQRRERKAPSIGIEGEGMSIYNSTSVFLPE